MKLTYTCQVNCDKRQSSFKKIVRKITSWREPNTTESLYNILLTIKTSKIKHTSNTDTLTYSNEILAKEGVFALTLKRVV